MTLLITAAGCGYVLSTSDMRITIQTKKGTFLSVDESFNKHIVFHSGGLTADISYTGLAQWQERGKTVNMYDVISDSITESVKGALSLGPLAHKLSCDVAARLGSARMNTPYAFEFHIVGRHEHSPYSFIGIISTFRKHSPWMLEGAFQWDYDFNGIRFFLKAADKPELVIGGMESVVRAVEKERMWHALLSGAAAYEMSEMAARLIEKASLRSQAVGLKSVAILLPETGFLDTNLWDKQQDSLVAFLPRTIFSNGTNWGPSEFPVDLSLLVDGYLPRQSLFFKSIVSNSYKRRHKRRIFRRRSGLAIPGIMGLIGLVLYGQVPEGYSDFGIGEE